MIDRIQEYETGFTDQAEEWKARALEYAANAGAKFDEGSEFLREYVKREPAKALGMAIGVGVVLGWLIKRR